MTATRRTKWREHVILFGIVPTLVFAAPYANAQSTLAAEPLHLTLPGAVDIALSHNRKLELAHLAVRQGEEQKRIAESSFYPVLNNQSRVLHITELQGVVIQPGAFGAASVAGAVPPQTVRIDQGSSTSYTSNTALDQPITQLFRVHAGLRAANADLAMAKVTSNDTRNEIALAVHQLYYALLIQQLNRSVAEDALKAATTADDENGKGVKEGRLLVDAELTSRAEMLDKQRALLVSNLNLDDLTLQLDDLLGLPIGTKLQLDPEVQGEALDLPSREQAMEQVLSSSPAVLTAKLAVEKAKAGLAIARDVYIPNVSIIAQYSYQSGLPFLEHNFGTFGASFTYNLFDGGAREAKLREARLKLTMAETALVQSESDVKVQVGAAYDKVEEIRELVKVSQLMLEAREESYRVQLKRSEVDAALASTVVSAHASTAGAKLNVLTAQLNLYLAQNEIKKFLGQLPR